MFDPSELDLEPPARQREVVDSLHVSRADSVNSLAAEFLLINDIAPLTLHDRLGSKVTGTGPTLAHTIYSTFLPFIHL